jgi:hypothetical protein
MHPLWIRGDFFVLMLIFFSCLLTSVCGLETKSMVFSWGHCSLVSLITESNRFTFVEGQH